MDNKTGPRLYIWCEILIFIVLVILTTLVLRPVQKNLQTRMEKIRDELIGRVENYIGRKIFYSSISPSIFGSLDIRNIRIAEKQDNPDSGTAPVLFISRFRISYSLLDLLRKKPQAIQSVRIDSPVISIDTERDRDLADFAGRLFGSSDFQRYGFPEDLTALIPERVLFRIRNGGVTVKNKLNVYRAQGLNLDVSVEDKIVSVQGKGNAGVSLSGIFDDPFTAQMSVRISGTCAADLSGGSAVFTIPALWGNRFRFHSLTLQASLADNTIAVRNVPGGLPFDFSLDYGVQSGELAALFNCDQFPLREMLSLSGSWRKYNPWLAMTVSGGASLTANSPEKIQYRADLSGAVPPGVSMGTSSFEIKAQGDEKAVHVEQFYCGIPRSSGSKNTGPGIPAFPGNLPIRGEVSFQGDIGLKPLAPNGRLVFSDLSLSGNEGCTADFTLTSQGREINIFGETVTLGKVQLTALDVSLFPSGGDFNFSLSALRFTGLESYEGVRLSSLSFEGSAGYEPRQIEASFMLDSFSAADLAEMAKPFVREPVLPGILQNIQEDTAITTEIFLTTDFEHILYNAPRLVIAYEGVQSVVGLISLSGTDQRFDLTEGRISWADGGFLFNGYADFSNPRELTFSMMANYQDLSYFLEGIVLDSRSISIQGSYGLRAYITAAGQSGYSGYIEAQDVPIPFRGQYARLSFLSALRYDSPQFWSFDVDKFEILDLSTPASPGAVFRATGGADQDGALFPMIYFDDGKGPLTGKAMLSWERDFSGFSGTLSVEEDQGNERYVLETGYREKKLDLRLIVFQAQLGRVMSNSYNAVADGDMRLSWNSAESFQAHINLGSLSARIQDAELRASASAALDDEEFFLRDVRIHYAGLEALMPEFRLNRSRPRMETAATIRGAAAGKDIDLAFTMDAETGPSGSWLGFRGAMEYISGAVHVSEARIDTLRSDKPFDVVFSRNGPVLSLSGGPRNMIRFQIDDGGDFYAGLSSPSPIQGSLIGTITSKTIDARTSDLYVDLKSLWNFVPRQVEIGLSGGYVNADLEIRGPLWDPEFFGQARGNSVRLQVPAYISKDIMPVPFSITIEGNEMTFGPVPATVGGGAGEARGWFRFDRWVPNIFSIDVRVPQKTPIPYSFDITGFLAHGSASGFLNLAMENLVFSISGDLTAHDTEISLNTDEIVQAAGVDMFSRAAPPVVLDIRVTTGQKVEFVYPSAEFPILQANVDMGTKVRVTADTLARRFSLTSDVKIRSGEIFYFERSFYIREGLLTFRENEIQFDPRITVRAEVRDRTSEGPVTISMFVENAPLLSFTARFESSPPLSQMEILALLGQNLTGSSVDESTGAIQRAFVNSTTDLLAQFSVVRRLERQIRNFLHLDMFSVRTQVLQNAFFQAAGLQGTVDRINGVGNYFDNTTVFFGKYIGRDMFVQSMLSFRYDKNKTTWGGLTFEPDIGVELETPLFNIRWDFIPTHPENWYINDNSITLTWTRSF
ncbi:MAG: translocation/assembly module TamB [Spirochaetaceae bacterium]|nr:translocation/assembly module TamB [Spirochaetaceae bacterium]